MSRKAKLLWLSTLGAASQAQAAMPDYSTLTAAVSFDAVATAIGVIFVSLIGFSLFMAGGQIIWRKVRGAKGA